MGKYNFGAENEQTKKKFNEWFKKFDVQYNVPVEQTASMFQGANNNLKTKIHNLQAKAKVQEWYFEVDNYISDYAKTVSDYCVSKGYITEINRSKQSLSTYIKLYENEQQKEDKAHEIMLNAYYVMNDKELPKEFIEDDINSKRNYDDLKKLPN